MITPNFKMEQDEMQLIIIIHAPFTNVKNTEIHVEEDDVRFFSAPYYLRLTLPGKVQETDNSSAKYDADTSKFTIRLEKMTPGEVFPNLDMLNNFIQPRRVDKHPNMLIQEMDGSSGSASGMQTDESQAKLDPEEWSMEQTIEEEMSTERLLKQYKFGFGNNHSGMGTKYDVELGEIAEITNPDNSPPSDRDVRKYNAERDKFSDDHYLSDLLMGDDITRLEAFEFNVSSLNELTEKNRNQLKDLGKREYLFDKLWQKRVHLGLVDILFAYCYDWRTTEGCHTVESPWTISRLSATLSWFTVFETVQEVVLSCLRRSLCYPLYRNWDLSKKVFEDVSKVLRTGQTGILVCLLDILDLFNKREPYYLLNMLYIKDYCVWVQSMPKSNLSSINIALGTTLFFTPKRDVGLELDDLELAAKLVEEEEMEEDISSQVEKMNFM